MNFVEDASVELIPGLVDVEILTRSPGEVKTYWVHACIRSDEPPADFIDALNAIGFSSSSLYASAPAYKQDGVNIQFIDHYRQGSAMFKGWTASEGIEAMENLRAVFKRFGLTFATREVSIEELL